MIWTVARFPNGQWTTGGNKNSTEYEDCEVFVVEADTRDSAKKKAQAMRKKQRMVEKRLRQPQGIR